MGSHLVFGTLILTLLIFPGFHLPLSIRCGIYYVTETEEVFYHLSIALIGLLIISLSLCEGHGKVLQCVLMDWKQVHILQTRPSLCVHLSSWVTLGQPLLFTFQLPSFILSPNLLFIFIIYIYILYIHLNIYIYYIFICIFIFYKIWIQKSTSAFIAH